MSHLMPLGLDEFHNPDFLNGGKMRLFHSALSRAADCV